MKSALHAPKPQRSPVYNPPTPWKAFEVSEGPVQTAEWDGRERGRTTAERRDEVNSPFDGR